MRKRRFGNYIYWFKFVVIKIQVTMEEIGAKCMKVVVEGKIWLCIGGDTFLGHGKIELMEKIKEFGTLNKAS